MMYWIVSIGRIFPRINFHRKAFSMEWSQSGNLLYGNYSVDRAFEWKLAFLIISTMAIIIPSKLFCLINHFISREYFDSWAADQMIKLYKVKFYRLSILEWIKSQKHVTRNTEIKSWRGSTCVKSPIYDGLIWKSIYKKARRLRIYSQENPQLELQANLRNSK